MRRDTYFLKCGMYSICRNIEGCSRSDKKMRYDSFAIFP